MHQYEQEHIPGAPQDSTGQRPGASGDPFKEDYAEVPHDEPGDKLQDSILSYLVSLFLWYFACM